MSSQTHLMVLENLAIPTGVVRPGARIRDFLTECIRCKVPGLPYVDATGRIIGRISLRHCFKTSCIPLYLIEAAAVLGDNIEEVNIPDVQVEQFLDEPVERHLLKPMARTSSRSPVIKGLAIMERFNTGYIFLIDDGVYKGVVTHLEIAQRLIEHSRFNQERRT